MILHFLILKKNSYYSLILGSLNRLNEIIFISHLTVPNYYIVNSQQSFPVLIFMWIRIETGQKMLMLFPQCYPNPYALYRYADVLLLTANSSCTEHSLMDMHQARCLGRHLFLFPMIAHYVKVPSGSGFVCFGLGEGLWG